MSVVKLETSLTERARKWSTAMRDASCGPLVVAPEILRIAEKWQKYQEEAGGLSATAWLKKKLGQNLAWFARRAEAVEALGKESATYFNHDAAVWAVQSIRDVNSLTTLKETVFFKTRKNGNNPLSAMVVRAIAVEVCGYKSRDKAACARCERLEKALADAGVEVPE